MTSRSVAKSLTVRIPVKLYSKAADIAKRRAVSMNALVQGGLEAIVRAEEEQPRYDAYTLLARDTEECDVEYAIHAQAEVMLRE